MTIIKTGYKSELLHICIAVIISLAMFSCNNLHTASKEKTNYGSVNNQNFYAKGFAIKDTFGERIISVLNPWQQARDVVMTYHLSNGKSKIDSSNYIKTPIRRVVCLSTTHLAMLCVLDEREKIVGISGARLVTDSIIKTRFAQHKIVDVGYDQTLNFELLASLKPDIIFAYGVSSDISNYVYKLTEMGLKVVLVAEYLETSPLAKAEWIKFFGEFFNKRKDAAAIFDSIQTNYNQLQTLAQNVSYKPKVMSGLPWNGSWYVSGNKSYMAKLIEDAGGDYIWKDLDSHESVPLDLELIYVKVIDAEYWINLSTAHKKVDVIASDERFGSIVAFKKGNLYNNNARETPIGGNDYFESGTCHPDVILSDLVKIFHPELLPDKKLYYYRKIE